MPPEAYAVLVQMLRSAVAPLEQEVQALTARVTKIEATLQEHTEEIGMLMLAVRRLAGAPVPLTPEHRGEVRARVLALGDRLGWPQSVVEDRLVVRCRAETMAHLAEEHWLEIMAWFRRQLGW